MLQEQRIFIRHVCVFAVQVIRDPFEGDFRINGEDMIRSLQALTGLRKLTLVRRGYSGIGAHVASALKAILFEELTAMLSKVELEMMEPDIMDGVHKAELTVALTRTLDNLELELYRMRP